MPPKAPICSEVIPSTVAVEPSSRFSTPPVRLIMAEMLECITKKETAAARAATSFSWRAIPMATPMAKIKGRLSKITPPHLLKTEKIKYGTVPGPISPSRL